MRNRSVLLSAALALSLFGCNSQKSPSQKEEANRSWNGARASVLASLANEQFASGNFEKCRRTLDDALKLVPDSEPLHILSAKLDIENGQLELAEQELKLARHYRPADPEPYYLSGVVYQRWQKPDVAYDFYHQAAAKAPAELAYLLAQGEMLVAMDRSPEALQMLASRVTYFEHSGAIRDAVGQLLVQAGRYHEAAAMFREASILSEDDAGVRERLGRDAISGQELVAMPRYSSCGWCRPKPSASARICLPCSVNASLPWASRARRATALKRLRSWTNTIRTSGSASAAPRWRLPIITAPSCRSSEH